MGSKSLLSSSVHGQTLGQASGGYSCTEKYDWQKLSLHQSEQAAREQLNHDATVHCPLDMPSRVEDSVTANEISHPPRGSYDLHSTRAEIVNYRYCNCDTCGVKRLGEYTVSHGHGRSEIHGPENGVSGKCHLSSCSYGGCHGKDHARVSNTSKQARRSISPALDPIRSYRSPSFSHGHHGAKGARRQICQARSCRKNFSANHGSSSQNRHHGDDRYLPCKHDFLGGHFSEIDAEMHRSYMRRFHSPSKHKEHSWKDATLNIPVHTSHVRSCQRDEEERAHPKRQVNEFRSLHHGQLELSPNENFHECLDSHRNFRNAYNGKMVKRKFIKQGFHESTYNGAGASKYERNTSQKRKADHFGAKKARRNVAYKDKSKRLRWPSEKDQKQQVETDKRRNGSLEGNAEITKFVGRDGGQGNCDLKKDATTPAEIGSTKCDENANMLSPKCSKTVSSPNTSKLSKGSSDMDLESDKQSDVDGCTKRGILQHLPVTHTMRNAELKESDNLSQSEALRQDCLILWRARQLRKANADAKADKIVKADQQQTGQRRNVSAGRRVRNRRPAAFASSESDNEDDSALGCSDQFSSATSSDGQQKCDYRRANKKLERPFKFLSDSECNKIPQNATAEKGLECSLKLPPEANPLELAHQKEKEKLLNMRQLSTDHPDAMVHGGLNVCSDTSMMDEAVVSHCDNRAHQNISHQEMNNADRRKAKLGVKCEKKAEGHGAKWTEQSTSLYTEPTLLDQETISRCSMHGNLKVNALETLNHESGSTPFHDHILDGGTANMCQKKQVNRSSGSYFRDFKNWLDGNNHRDSQQEAMDRNHLRKKQVCSVLADPENELNENDTKDCERQALGVENTSNRQITREECTSNTTHSGAAKQGDWIPRSSIPDLNCSPSMLSDEDFVAPEEPVCQVTADGFEPQNVTKSLLASLNGPTVEEQYEQVKEQQCRQAAATQIISDVCKKEGTSEVAVPLEISESNTGPPQRSAVEESGTPIDAFKSALCEFVRNFLKPLWENGLVSREVHKMIVKKAVEKVAGAWALNAPSTEPDISRILSDEAKNIERLVKGYLNMYVGREVLKSFTPGGA